MRLLARNLFSSPFPQKASFDSPKLFPYYQACSFFPRDCGFTFARLRNFRLTPGSLFFEADCFEDELPVPGHAPTNPKTLLPRNLSLAESTKVLPEITPPFDYFEPFPLDPTPIIRTLPLKSFGRCSGSVVPFCCVRPLRSDFPPPALIGFLPLGDPQLEIQHCQAAGLPFSP